MIVDPSPTMHVTSNHRPYTTPIIHLFLIWGPFPNSDIRGSRKTGPSNVTICYHASQRFPPVLMVRVYPGKDCVFLNTGFPIQSPRQITAEIDFHCFFPQGCMTCSFFHDLTPLVSAFLLALHWQLMCPTPICGGTQYCSTRQNVIICTNSTFGKIRNSKDTSKHVLIPHLQIIGSHESPSNSPDSCSFQDHRNHVRNPISLTTRTHNILICC